MERNAELMQGLMIDNDIDKYQVLANGTIIVEEFWDLEVMSRLNSRISQLESQVGLLRESQEYQYIHPQHEGRTIQAPL